VCGGGGDGEIEHTCMYSRVYNGYGGDVAARFIIGIM